MIGIDKSVSGFANPGYSYHAQVGYGFSGRFFAFVRAGGSVNPVSEKTIEEFFTDMYSTEEQFHHTDYRLFTVTPGLGYSILSGAWGLHAGLFAGYGQCDYPYFERRLTFLGNGTIWAHNGDRPNLSTWATGGLVNLSYGRGRLRTGLEIAYQRADFDYTMTTRMIPGGSPNPEYQDTLKTSLLHIGLQLSYSLGGGK